MSNSGDLFEITNFENPDKKIEKIKSSIKNPDANIPSVRKQVLIKIGRNIEVAKKDQKKDEIDSINETISKSIQSKYFNCWKDKSYTKTSNRPYTGYSLVGKVNKDVVKMKNNLVTHFYEDTTENSVNSSPIKEYLENNNEVSISNYTKVNRFLSSQTTESNQSITVVGCDSFSDFNASSLKETEAKLGQIETPIIKDKISRAYNNIKSTYIDTDTISFKNLDESGEEKEGSGISLYSNSKNPIKYSKSFPILRTNVFLIKANQEKILQDPKSVEDYCEENVKNKDEIISELDSSKIEESTEIISSQVDENSMLNCSKDGGGNIIEEKGPNTSLINTFKNSEVQRKNTMDPKKLEMMRTIINNRKSTAIELKSIKYERFSQIPTKYQHTILQENSENLYNRRYNSNRQNKNDSKYICDKYKKSNDESSIKNELPTVTAIQQMNNNYLISKSGRDSIKPVNWVPKKKQKPSTLKEDIMLNIELYSIMADSEI
ncbi:hypothetical protein AYI70_g7173 [Smittium culicis]|uniref:Uncharacterized protein n=1 Tax=Smittium culicis TaxID=133412 RepID=A0A1R1XLR2_9FUNG|nr:hypothetical protein AYI70_g7173 [Smittium culicis]